jgi:hypothetical protein
MRIIFSRKGFDTGSGGGPSPVINGRPISLPIPAGGRSHTRYDDLELGEMVEKASRGRISRSHLCHEDPMFFDGYCLFGQCGAAQSHLTNQGVGPGDIFLFFGLFADEHTGERHHRIFGWLRVDRIIFLSTGDQLPNDIPVSPRLHPHVIGERPANNTVYSGEGSTARSAHEDLRLTRSEGPLCRWAIPDWVQPCGLSYHGRPDRWHGDGSLTIVSRGQEFVTDIGEAEEPRRWLDRIIRLIGL